MFVYSGEDTYESYLSAKEHIKQIAKDKNSNFKIINEDEINSVNDFLYNLESIDIFGSSSIIFAKRIFNNKDISNYFTENIESLKNSELIIWTDKPLDKKTKLYKTLSLHKLFKEFVIPKPFELKNWIKNKSKDLNILLTETACNFIIENVSTDKWIIEKELQKLNMLDRTKADTEDIKEIFGLTVKGDLWKFLDQVGYRDKFKAIVEFEKLTKYEDTSQLIISLLHREFKIIAQILSTQGDRSQLSNLGLPSFLLNKGLEKSKKYTFKEVKNFITRLFNLDYAIKSGEIDDKIGLTLLLLTL